MIGTRHMDPDVRDPDSRFDSQSVEFGSRSRLFLDHVSRYWWAHGLAGDMDVLDCACGKGYGSFILASSARSVLGIDLSQRSLDMARLSFNRDNIEYRLHDVLEVDGLGRRFDLITAFEIIEHIPSAKTERFLSGLSRSLKPRGKLLLSTPNDNVVRHSGVPIPEYHINNFSPSRLRSTLEGHFSNVKILGQYQQRSMLYYLVFSLDFLNLRHILLGNLGRFLAHRSAVAMERAAEEAWHGSYPPVEYFSSPPKEFPSYRFSPWHWRQAGITLAICEGSADRSRG